MMTQGNSRLLIALCGVAVGLILAAAAAAQDQPAPVPQAPADQAAQAAVAPAAPTVQAEAGAAETAVEEGDAASPPAAATGAQPAQPQGEGDYFVQDEGQEDEQYQEDETGAVSPSQISRDRINAIRSNDFFYQSFGRQDPFQVLVSGKFEQSASKELLDVHAGKLVGVMWGQDDQFALVEDGDGFGYILRVGDRVQNGRVVSIRKNSLTARVTLYGITNQVVLKLENTEG